MINVNLSAPTPTPMPPSVPGPNADPASFAAATQEGVMMAAVAQQADMQDALLSQQKNSSSDQAAQGLLQLKIGDDGGVSVGGGGAPSLASFSASAPVAAPAEPPASGGSAVGQALSAIAATTRAVTDAGMEIAQDDSEGADAVAQLTVGDTGSVASAPAGTGAAAGVGGVTGAIQTLSAVVQSGAAGAATPVAAATAVVAKAAVRAAVNGNMPLLHELLGLLASLKDTMEHITRFGTASSQLDILQNSGRKLGSIQSRLLHAPKPRMPTALDLLLDMRELHGMGEPTAGPGNRREAGQAPRHACSAQPARNPASVR